MTEPQANIKSNPYHQTPKYVCLRCGKTLAGMIKHSQRYHYTEKVTLEPNGSKKGAPRRKAPEVKEPTGSPTTHTPKKARAPVSYLEIKIPPDDLASTSQRNQELACHSQQYLGKPLIIVSVTPGNKTPQANVQVHQSQDPSQSIHAVGTAKVQGYSTQRHDTSHGTREVGK